MALSLGIGIGMPFASAPGGGFAGPLDEWEDALYEAWALARLFGSYSGPLIRVRADRSGQPEADIGALGNGALDTDSILALRAGQSCAVYVTKWYGQKGMVDLSAPSSSVQLRICTTAGVIEGIGTYYTPKAVQDPSGGYCGVMPSGYVGTDLTAFAAHVLTNNTANYSRIFSVVKSGNDYQSAGAAAPIIKNATTQGIRAYRNNAPIGADEAIVWGNVFCASSRMGSSLVRISVDGTETSAADGNGALDITKILVGGQWDGVAYMRPAEYAVAYALALSDLGAEDTETVRRALLNGVAVPVLPP